MKITTALIAISAISTNSLATDHAKTVQDGAGQVANVWKFPEYFASCMKIDAIRNKALADLRLVSEFDKTLGWVGPALGLTEAAAAAARGQNLEALQKIGGVGIDQAICVKKPVLCPAWAVGRTLGEVVNYMVSAARADSKSATEVLEDFYVAKRIEGPATARELLRLQASLDAAKASRERVLRDSLSCADPSQTPQGVDALLNAAARMQQGPTPSSRPPLRSTPPMANCETLKDTIASERLSASDPDAYDALLARCL